MNNDANEKKKILIVDDNMTNLMLAETYLKDEYEIDVVKSGTEAITYLLNKLNPNLVLLDILMPDVDGWEVFNRIRAISFLKDIPIAFLTAVHGEAEKKRAYEIGAVDYITKPYHRKALRDRVREILIKA